MTTSIGGCESDTDIRGEIVLGEPMSLDAIPGEPTSLGLLDDWVLVTSSRPVIDGDPDLWGDTVVETLITWIDPEGNIGETTSLGWAQVRTGETPRWLAWEGELWASVLAADPSAPPPVDRDYIRIVSVSPTNGIGCSVRPDLPVLESDMFLTVDTLTGVGGYNPAVLSPRGPVFGLSAIPETCSAFAFADDFRPLLVEGCGDASWLPEDGACLRPNLLTRCIQLAAHGDEIGVLAASSVSLASDPPSHWQRFSRGVSVSPPALVGSRRPSGFRGVAVPSVTVLGDTVLWLDATEDEGFCSFVRSMRWDGTDAQDAPWQPPCAEVQESRFTIDHLRTGTSTDILPWGDLALFVSIDGPTALNTSPARAIVHGMRGVARPHQQTSRRVPFSEHLRRHKEPRASWPIDANQLGFSCFDAVRTNGLGAPVLSLSIPAAVDLDLKDEWGAWVNIGSPGGAVLEMRLQLGRLGSNRG